MAQQRITVSISDTDFHPGAAVLCLLTVLMLVAASPAQTFTVLHTFRPGGYGQNPPAGLTLHGSGGIYGVATYSAGGDGGGAFKLSEHGSGWAYNILFNHTGAENSKLVVGPDGNLYGAAAIGGIDGPCGEGGGCGMVFMLQPPPTVCPSFSCPWTETVLYEFGGESDGGNPDGEVVFDAAGNLYGVTLAGGSANCYEGCGVIYKLTRSGSAWSESVIHTFLSGNDGRAPSGGLVFDQAGNLYGLTEFGGSDTCDYGCGLLYELSPSNGGWTETILHNFQSSGGYYPGGTLAIDPAGNLYGVVGGNIFEMSHSATYSLIYTFTDDSLASTGLTFDQAGNLYGDTIQAGQYGNGYVYELSPSGGTWTLSHLHDFSYSDGTYANGLLTLDASGNIYGTSGQGGFFSDECYPANGCGTAWEITRN